MANEARWPRFINMGARRGLLVAFSGINGAGKSTQIELLMDRLRQEGQNPTYVWTRSPLPDEGAHCPL